MANCRRAYSGNLRSARRMGGLQALLQRQFAVLARQVLECGRFAGDGCRQRTVGRRIGISLPDLSRYMSRVCRARRLLARIHHGLEAVGLPVQQVEPAAPQA